MDERLKKALDISNFLTTFNDKKRIMEEKYQENLFFYYNGCQFTVTRELITFIGYLIDYGQTDAVIVDDNKIPVMVDDLSKFYEDILDVYFTASNSYFKEYTELKKQRSVEKLVNYDKE